MERRLSRRLAGCQSCSRFSQTPISKEREENDGAGKPISSSDVALTHAFHSNNLLQNVPFT